MTALTDQTAVVTGGSGAIGGAVARRLGAEGATVVVGYGSNADAASAVVDEIVTKGGTATARQADIRDAAEVEQLFQNAAETSGGIDIVVHCAGRHFIKPIADTTDEEYDDLFALNTRGAFLVLREAARQMTDGGRIVVLSASSTQGGFGAFAPNSAAASGSKAAVELFARGAAQELGPRGIRVNVVSSGPMATESFERLPDAVRNQAAGLSPLARVGEVGELANAVAFLVGPESSWVNAENVRVAGA